MTKPRTGAGGAGEGSTYGEEVRGLVVVSVYM